MHVIVRVGLLWTLSGSALVAQSPDRLYGVVTTAQGERLEGYLRWDRNEAAWTDHLDAVVPIPWDVVHEAERLDETYRRLRERARTLSLPDVRIVWDEDDVDDPLTRRVSIPFGEIAELVPIDDGSARLALRSGEEMEVRSDLADLGVVFRGLIVETRARGRVELEWEDLGRLELADAPPGAGSAPARLHGIVTTSDGTELAGFVGWDREETLVTDTLDGEVGGRSRRIRFADVAWIRRDGTRRAEVGLTSGEAVTLRGTRDVSSDNLGVEVDVAGLGSVLVDWRHFESFTVHDAPEALAPRSSFGGGQPLRGVVETRDGRRVEGRLRLNHGPASTAETLIGTGAGLQYAVHLAAVSTLQPAGRRGAVIGLRSGGVVTLDDCETLAVHGLGVVVEADGAEPRVVRWSDVGRVTFQP